MNRRQKVVIKAAIKLGVEKRLTDPAVRSRIAAFITRIRSSLQRGYVNSQDSNGLFDYVTAQAENIPGMRASWKPVTRIQRIVDDLPGDGQMKEIDAESKAGIEVGLRVLLEYLR